mmetsp:Transcript_13120/g.36850  ORF Transcript_13120/g.36850 Transcript_13120/m.36850 type:complete len:252 (+) Transcript_13120:513-1268(+)
MHRRLAAVAPRHHARVHRRLRPCRHGAESVPSSLHRGRHGEHWPRRLEIRSQDRLVLLAQVLVLHSHDPGLGFQLHPHHPVVGVHDLPLVALVGTLRDNDGFPDQRGFPLEGIEGLGHGTRHFPAPRPSAGAPCPVLVPANHVAGLCLHTDDSQVFEHVPALHKQKVVLGDVLHGALLSCKVAAHDLDHVAAVDDVVPAIETSELRGINFPRNVFTLLLLRLARCQQNHATVFFHPNNDTAFRGRKLNQIE